MFPGSFRAYRPQHPLARLLVGVIGLVIAALLIAFSVFAMIALAVGGAIFMLVRALRSSSPTSARTAPGAGTASASAAPSPGVIEGEFTVVPASHSRDMPAASSR
ncbi:MAG: hypothetical protein ABIS07_00190 [Dokdonella sp.]